jgi:tetratricopeptide (TPR) repeat protein
MGYAEQQTLRQVTSSMHLNAKKLETTVWWRHWGARIAVAILVPIFILGAVEGGLRIFGVGTPTGVLRACRAQGKPAFCNNVFFTKPFFPPGMIRAPHPYAIPAGKERGTFRIFVLGESAAYGDPDPAYGFSRYLETMLRQSFPEMKFEVVNTAATAINSHVLLPIAREAAEHQPDLFIIYAGNNEVVGPYGPGTVLTRPAMSLPVIRASIYLRQSRLGQLLAKVATPKEKPQEWHGMEMFLDTQIPANSPMLQDTYRNFSANLTDMIAVAHRSGARVLLSTVVVNLRDCAPFASAHRKGLSESSLEKWSDFVQQGAQLENAGSHAGALKLYFAAAKIDDQYAELQFRIATALWKLGDFKAAGEHFVRAQDLDTLRFRADSKINDAIRSVAASAGSGAELVDAAKIFAQQSEHEVTGSDLLYEHVHLSPRGNYLLASAMFQRIADMLPPEARRSNPENTIPSEADCERQLAFTRYDRARLAGEILQRLQRPPFTNQINQKDQVRKMSAVAQSPSDTFEKTAAQYEWAINQNADDHLLHLNYGLLLYDRDRDAATVQFRNARPYDDIPFVAPDGTLIR